MQDLPRTIGFWGAAGIMIGVTIGSGIFQTPPEIAREMSSPWLILLLWVLGGVLSLMGALTYSELATMFPRSGGLYNFLYQGFGRPMAFVFGWTYMLLTKPMAAAGIAIVFAQNVTPTLRHLGAGAWLTDEIAVCIALTCLTGINILGMRLGSGIGVVLTAVKVSVLLALVLLALVFQAGDANNLRSEAVPIKPWHLALAAVMSSVLWTYDGWSDVGSVAGEVKDPQRKLPLIYLVGTLATIAIYVAVNAAYMWMLPLSDIRGVTSIAPAVAQRLIGDVGSGVATAVVVISTLGATHASIITGARITFAQARDGLLFRFLGHMHPRFKTPDVSLITQLVLSCAAVLFLKDFRSLAGGFVFTMWIFYALGGASLLVLRKKRPGVPRPFRCPGYPFVPIVFILAGLGMSALELHRGWMQDDWKPFIWIGVLAAGYPMYFVWNRLARRAASHQRTPT